MMRRLLSILMLLINALPASAAPESLCPALPIRFAHYEFGLIYSTGYGGIDDDFQKELERRSGCPFEVSVQPRARIWKSLESGDLDMAGSGIQTPERDKFAWFFPYIVEDNIVVLGPRVPADVRSFEQFLARPKLNLGGVRAYRYSRFYDQYVDRLELANRLNLVADPGGLYRMFEAGRTDGFITNPILYLYFVKHLGAQPPARIERWDPAGPSPSGLVLAKKTFTDAQARQWQALVNKMLADGTIQKIVVKHMGAEFGPKTVFRPSKKIVGPPL